MYSRVAERFFPINGYYSLGAAAPAATPQQAPVTSPYEAPQTFWQEYGAEILVGTISAVTSAVAVYFAMRVFEKRS